MSNPTFVQGPITFTAAQALEKFTLVAVNDEGKLVPATADERAFGAVTEKADPANTALPDDVAVHYGPAAVKLIVDGDASVIKAGAPVYAAANGRVSATGTVQIGVAARDGSGDRVLTVLNRLPA